VPVRMRVRNHFYYVSPPIDRYKSLFIGNGNTVSISLPPDVPDSEPYDQSTPSFSFLYNRDGKDYSTYDAHAFIFDIIDGGSPGGEITAIFEGELCDVTEIDCIDIDNGELSARISD